MRVDALLLPAWLLTLFPGVVPKFVFHQVSPVQADIFGNQEMSCQRYPGLFLTRTGNASENVRQQPKESDRPDWQNIIDH